jgi:leukotriene-A4 hydrolase
LTAINRATISHLRSIGPASSCRRQDTPAVKSTFDAAVRVPAPLTALMGAIPVEEGGGDTDGLAHLPAAARDEGRRHRVFRFRQRVPVPSYLLALAVRGLT